MKQSLRFKILEELKRCCEGLPVRELAHRLGMSYMGVKDQCTILMRDGYLSHWRNPRPVGRPEILYRLAPKAAELFPRPDNSALIELLRGAAELYGENAPGKLLLMFFKRKTAFYQEHLSGETIVERLECLASLRDREGCYARVELMPPMRIIENHQPLSDVFDVFPEGRLMEQRMFARLLGGMVRREEKRISGACECVFYVES